MHVQKPWVERGASLGSFEDVHEKRAGHGCFDELVHTELLVVIGVRLTHDQRCVRLRFRFVAWVRTWPIDCLHMRPTHRDTTNSLICLYRTYINVQCTKYQLVHKVDGYSDKSQICNRWGSNVKQSPNTVVQLQVTKGLGEVVNTDFPRRIGCLHDEANMKQMYWKYTCTACAVSLLRVCFIV